MVAMMAAYLAVMWAAPMVLVKVEVKDGHLAEWTGAQSAVDLDAKMVGSMVDPRDLAMVESSVVSSEMTSGEQKAVLTVELTAWC